MSHHALDGVSPVIIVGRQEGLPARIHASISQLLWRSNLVRLRGGRVSRGWNHCPSPMRRPVPCEDLKASIAVEEAKEQGRMIATISLKKLGAGGRVTNGYYR